MPFEVSYQGHLIYVIRGELFKTLRKKLCQILKNGVTNVVDLVL